MTSSEAVFKQNYQTHLKQLKLKGLQPKTIEAYSRAMRRIGTYFDYQVADLSEPQLTDYFSFPIVTADSSRRIWRLRHWIEAVYKQRYVKSPKIAA